MLSARRCDLHLPAKSWCWTAFHVPGGHLHVFLGKTFVWVHFWKQIIIIFWFVFATIKWVVGLTYIFWISIPSQIYGLTGNFRCHLPGPRVRRPTVFLGVSGRAFLGKISIWVCGLSQINCPPVWVGLTPPIEGMNRTKRWWKDKFAPFVSYQPAELGHGSSPVLGLGYTPAAPWVLRPSDEDQRLLPSFLGLQLAARRSPHWDSASITVRANPS